MLTDVDDLDIDKNCAPSASVPFCHHIHHQQAGRWCTTSDMRHTALQHGFLSGRPVPMFKASSRHHTARPGTLPCLEARTEAMCNTCALCLCCRCDGAQVVKVQASKRRARQWSHMQVERAAPRLWQSLQRHVLVFVECYVQETRTAPCLGATCCTSCSNAGRSLCLHKVRRHFL